MDSSDDERALEPLDVTRLALRYISGSDESSTQVSLVAVGRAVRAISPHCVALSLSMVEHGYTFTLVADGWSGSLMDAVQYLDDGPCVRAAGEAEVIALPDHGSRLPTNEDTWQLFAQAGAFLGIASTLSLPVHENGTAVASINLYGSTPDAFDDRHEQLAAACGGWAQDAVTNADLGFTSRVCAAATPDRVLEQTDVDTAAGLVSATRDIDVTTAGDLTRSAATRAGVTIGEFARFLLDMHAADVDRRTND